MIDEVDGNNKQNNQAKREKLDTLLKTEFPRSHQLSRAGVLSLDTNGKLSNRHMHILTILVFLMLYGSHRNHILLLHMSY